MIFFLPGGFRDRLSRAVFGAGCVSLFPQCPLPGTDPKPAWPESRLQIRREPHPAVAEGAAVATLSRHDVRGFPAQGKPKMTMPHFVR